MRRTAFFLLAAFCSLAVRAQTPVAPSTEPVGDARGQNRGGYNVVNSIEAGYRFRSVDGNLGAYRSDVNFGNGVRLLGGSLTVNSRDGNGRFFDELVVGTQGLGGDPYQNATLRLQKNNRYRYDFLWRQNDYFNPALAIAGGTHLLDTSRQLQDHDLTLLPGSRFVVFLGYSRNRQTGPALTTSYPFDAAESAPLLFQNVRRVVNEYRAGNEIRAFGFRLNWLRGWQNFKDDTPSGLVPGATPGVNLFARREPYHGNSPYWRVALFREGESRYALNGRFTYTEGRRNFILDESASGTGRFGAATNRQVLAFGSARRPVATGNLTASLFLGDKVTVTNHASVYNVRIDGDSSFREIDNNTLAVESLSFRYLGIRTVANQIELDVRPWARAGFFAGYNYSNRLVRSVAQTAFPPDSPSREGGEQTNQLHAGAAGVRLKPLKPLTLTLDAELGRADRPLYPVSDRNYHLLRARGLFRTRTLTVTAYARANYNVNSTSLTSFSSRTRDYAANVTWTPSARLGVDAGYSRLHVDTLGGIAYFVDFNLIQGDRSFYVSNIHAVTATARLGITRFADLFLGYNRVEDTGDGRATSSGAGLFSGLPLFQSVQAFPLAYESPLARLSIRLGKRLRWNAGYQFYRYREQFSTVRDYRAHTGFSSLLWSF